MTSIDLFLTNICNKECEFCFVKDKINNGSMSLEYIKKLIPQLKQKGITRVALVGGEPTIYNHLRELTELLYQYNIKYDFFSNGLFDKNKIDKIKIKNVQFSVHLPKDKKEEDIIISNMNYLKKRGAEVLVREVMTNEDYNFKKALLFLKENKSIIDGIRFKISQPTIGLTNKYIKDFNKIKPKLMIFLKAVKSLGIFISNCCFLPLCAFSEEELTFLKKINYISQCKRVIYNDVNGDIKLCPFHDNKLGDINDLTTILKNKNNLLYPLNETCKECKHFKSKECIPCFAYTKNPEKLFDKFKKIIYK